METLKNIVKSISCSILIASLSIPVVYVFGGMVGGGLDQVSRDLRHLLPEKEEIISTVSNIEKTNSNKESTLSSQMLSDNADK